MRSPRGGGPRPDVRERDFMHVQDLLSKYRHFIVANSHRLPEFASSIEAKAELARLAHKLSGLQLPTTEVARRMTLLSERHATLLQEDGIISELRALSRSSADREAEEYHSIVAELADAKSRLASLKQKLAVNNRKTTTARQSVHDAEHDLELRRAKAERLRNEKTKLEQAQHECLQAIRSVERDITKLNGRETLAEEPEKTAAARAAHLRVLDARLSELRSACDSKAVVISQTVAEIESMEETIDRAIDQGFVMVHPSSSGDEDDATVRELLGERHELLSEPAAAVAEALAVIQMPLDDASEVKRKRERSLPQAK